MYICLTTNSYACVCKVEFHVVDLLYLFQATLLIADEDTSREASDLGGVSADRRNSLSNAPLALANGVLGAAALIGVLDVVALLDGTLELLDTLALKDASGEALSLVVVDADGGNSLGVAPLASRDGVLRVLALSRVLNVVALLNGVTSSGESDESDESEGKSNEVASHCVSSS